MPSLLGKRPSSPLLPRLAYSMSHFNPQITSGETQTQESQRSLTWKQWGSSMNVGAQAEWVLLESGGTLDPINRYSYCLQNKTFKTNWWRGTPVFQPWRPSSLLLSTLKGWGEKLKWAQKTKTWAASHGFTGLCDWCPMGGLDALASTGAMSAGSVCTTAWLTLCSLLWWQSPGEVLEELPH